MGAVQSRMRGRNKSAALKPLQQIIDGLSSLSRRPKPLFLELGAELTILRRDYPEEFEKVASAAGLSRRRAFYLMQVHGRFHPFASHAHRLAQIGWTKLQILSPIIDKDNFDEMLILAETNSVNVLKILVRGKSTTVSNRCVLIYFNVDQYAIYEEAIMANGGGKRGRQLTGQESALTKALSMQRDESTDR